MINAECQLWYQTECMDWEKTSNNICFIYSILCILIRLYSIADKIKSIINKSLILKMRAGYFYYTIVKRIEFPSREVGNVISRHFPEKNLQNFSRISAISRKFYFSVRSFISSELREEYRKKTIYS